MKYLVKTFFVFIGFGFCTTAPAQNISLPIPANITIKDFYFHLYTDSLKKEVYNYINVDALLSNGNYWPLDTNYVLLRSTAGAWHGNSLLLGKDSLPDSVVVSATLRTRPALTKSVTIFVKKIPNPDTLPSEKEVLERINQERRRNKTY